MRSARLLVVLGLILSPSLASAQEKNPFIDSWFWGAKGGMASLPVPGNPTVGVSTANRTNAPAFGIDWLITRTWYALNVSLDQAYFNGVSTVADAGANTNNGVNASTTVTNSGVQRRVDIRDMRRVAVTMDMFPKVFNESVRPYFGLGYALNYVVQAASEGNDFAGPAAKDTVLQRIQAAKSRGSVMLTAGLQIDVKKWAPFVQATVMPTQGAGGKFLINGNGFTYYIEGGIRYNFGSSIEKLK